MRTPKYSSSIWGKLRSLRLCSDYAPRNGGMAAWKGCYTGITGFRLMMMRLLLVMVVSLYASAAAGPKLSALVIDGMNNHDWAAGTRAIQSILEGSGRFTVTVCTWPAKPDFSHHDVVIDNFNGGHTAEGTRWPREVEQALESYVRGGGGLVVFHAANNAFLNWPAYNDMIGLGWRDKTFGEGIAIGSGGAVVRVPKGEGLNPGHGPRHNFEVFVRDGAHPITRGLPPHWAHPSEQLTHGQHGPAQGLDILTYAFSEVSHQGEPMDWVRQYGRGRVYTTLLGHTWKDELNPNLDDVSFQALLARGAEWAATGQVTLPADLGWRPLFDGKTLEGWEPRGDCGVSIRDRSRAHGAFDEPDAARPELAAFPKTTPAHIGYEIQIIDDDQEKYPSGSIYSLVAAKTGVQRPGAWNSMEIESRNANIRVRLNGQVVVEGSGEEARSKTGPIGLQLHDRFSTVMFRNLRIRETVR